MKRFLVVSLASSIALASGFAMAQDAPRSILPPGFGQPTPTPTVAPAPVQTAAPVPTAPSAPAAPSTGGEVVQPVPAPAPPSAPLPGEILDRLPTAEELEEMSTDELNELLGLKPTFDIPPAARRPLTRVGVLTTAEGGLPSQSLAGQDGELVEAVLAGLQGPLVSRWGHIVLRRSLLSRLAAPEGLGETRFAGLRASALNAIGEHRAARALVQSVDTGDWDQDISAPALDAFIGSADLLGACPAARVSGASGDAAEWTMLTSICNAYAGEASRAQSDLGRARRDGVAEPIDILLAQRYAGAAGQGRRAVNIEWDDVDELTPWRFALANALGEEIPERLRGDLPPFYERALAVTPSVPLAMRMGGIRRAGSEGILSASAMVDFYSQIARIEGSSGESAVTASRLRAAYIEEDPASRMAAIRDIWGSGTPDNADLVTTAYAAARMPASDQFADEAGWLIASMLSAGLDRNAARWRSAVDNGSLGWALVALSDPNGAVEDREAVDAFIDDDDSAERRKSAFLLAGLAGLGRIGADPLSDFSERVGVDFTPRTKWARMITAAGDADNRALVIWLAALGMQGDDWDQMTPRHVFAIVSALNAVGLNAEARMIAAEAVARG